MAHACSCALPRGESYLDRAEVAFVGHTTQSPPGGGVASTYEFTVDPVLAGDVGVAATVVSSSQPTACGVIFLTGRRYVVLAGRRDDGTLETNSCSGTARLRDGTLERLAEVVKVPRPSPGFEWSFAW